MKKLSIFAAAAAIAAASAMPVVAQESNDPFVSTQAAPVIPALAVIGGVAVIIAIAAGSGTD